MEIEEMAIILIASISILCSLIMLFTLWTSSVLTSKMQLLRIAVLWMSGSDIVWSIYMIISRSTDLQKNTREICVTIQFLCALMELTSVTWYFVIALATYLVLTGSSVNLNPKCCVIVVSIASVLLTVTGISLGIWRGIEFTHIDHKLVGILCNGKSDEMEVDIMSLFFYTPILMYMLFSIFLFFYGIYVMRSFDKISGGDFSSSLIRVLIRMLSFVGAFIIIWIIPIIFRIWQLLHILQFTTETVPDWIFIGSKMCKAFVGCGNFLVWISSRPFMLLCRQRFTIIFSPSLRRLNHVVTNEITEEEQGNGGYSRQKSSMYRECNYPSQLSGVPKRWHDDGSAEGTALWEDDTPNIRPILDAGRSGLLSQYS